MAARPPRDAGAPVSPVKLALAVRALADGGVVAYPTEAVWGLGCNPDNAGAFRRLLDIKGRDPAKGVIVIAASFDDVADWLEPFNEKIEDRALATWPGPVTWLWPASPRVPAWITGGQAKVAVRVTAHPVARALCAAWGGPLVSTSANRSGLAPARSSTEVRLRLGRDIDALLPGSTGGRLRPTPIRDLLSGRTLRA